MATIGFDRIREIFVGRTSDSERRELFKEVLLMILARAADADSNVSTVEVETVQRIVQRETDNDVSQADVRVAAASELFERAPLSTYLNAVTRDLLPEQRSTILRCLIEAITFDERISSGEIEFFNMVATALRATPTEIAGLSRVEVTTPH